MNWSDASDQLRKEQFMLEKNNSKMIQEITNLVNEVKSKLSSEINKSIIYVYWNNGKIIVSNENEFNTVWSMVKKF